MPYGSLRRALNMLRDSLCTARKKCLCRCPCGVKHEKIIGKQNPTTMVGACRKRAPNDAWDRSTSSIIYEAEMCEKI